jgi:hypothetical protein
MESGRRKVISAVRVLAGLLAALIPLTLAALAPASPASAQGLPNFDTQISAAQTALSAGNLDQALALADAAIRSGPERWDGYAVAGQALLGLRQYEPAADALSKAIERAPESQQGRLRAMRRECLVAESAGTAPPAGPAPSGPDHPIAPSPKQVVPAAVSRRAGQDQALWLDASTSLMWARPWYYPQSGAIGPWNLGEAQSFCAMLDLADYSNWRLPSADELQHVFHASGNGWHWIKPTFDPGYGIGEALKKKQWRPPEFGVDGDHFPGDRVLLWTSTPADKPGEHIGLYFGKRYRVRDDQRIGSSFEESASRTPFQGYALCVRTAN